MTWRIVQASAAGTSQLARNKDCEDECLALVVQFPHEPHEVLIAVLADGAGSAVFGGEGARLTVTSTFSILKDKLPLLNNAVDAPENVLVDVLEEVRSQLRQNATARDVELREFACTVLGSVIFEHKAIFFQIGDGAIIGDFGNSLEAVFWPDAGEYVNATYFLTDDRWHEQLQTRVIDGEIGCVSLLSDGLQRLALRYADKSVHHPFFAPMLKNIEGVGEDKVDGLSDSLHDYLTSGVINSRTDDDKTLIIALKESRDGGSTL